MKKVVFIGVGLCNPEVYGIQRYTLEILKALDRMVPPGVVELMIAPRDVDNFNFKNIRVVRIGIKLRFWGNKARTIENYLYRHYYTGRYVRKNGCLSVDLLLQFPKYGCDVIAIHDCRIELFPEYTIGNQDRKWAKKLILNQKRAIDRCRMIITVSLCSKVDIRKVYHVDENKVIVVPNAWQHFSIVEEDTGIIERLGLKNKQYFFSLGSRKPHKNIKWVSCAARQNPQYTFVISGSPREYKDFSFEGEIQPNMVFAGYLSDAEVKTLYRYCRAFIQPSFYEGFGIPPMEAMSVGADCIVSNRGSLPEVYKNSVWYINPSDYDHINLDEIMSRPKESNDVILNGYSWEKSAQKLWETLKSIM